MNVKTTYLFISLISLLVGCEFGFAQSKSARLTFRSPDLSELDTIEIHVWSNIFGNPYTHEHKVLRATLDKGEAVFVIDSTANVCWVSANFSYQKAKMIPMYGVFDMLPIAAADDMIISLTPQRGRYQNIGTGYDNGEIIFEDNWKCSFSGGKSAERMRIAYESKRFLTRAKEEYYVGKSIEEVLKYFEVLEVEFLSNLKDNDAELSLHDKTLLEIDGLSKIRLEKLAYLNRKRGFLNEGTTERLLVVNSMVQWRESIADMAQNHVDIAKLSPHFVDYVADLMYVLAMYGENRDVLKVAVELADIHIADKDLKDRVWTQLLVEHFARFANKDLLDKVLSEIKFAEGRKLIKPFGTLVDGDTQLDFSLPDSAGKMHRLKDYRGKVVLIDFWYMGCVPCRAYIEDVLTPLMDGKSQLGDFELIMVSVDNKSDFTKALASGIIPRGTLNLFTDSQRFKHSVIKDLGIRGFPYPLLIDKNGVIVGRGNELKELDKLVTRIKANK